MEIEEGRMLHRAGRSTGRTCGEGRGEKEKAHIELYLRLEKDLY